VEDQELFRVVVQGVDLAHQVLLITQQTWFRPTTLGLPQAM